MAEEIRANNRWLLLPLLAALLAVRPAAAPSPPASAHAQLEAGRAPAQEGCLSSAGIDVERVVTAPAPGSHRGADEALCAAAPAVKTVGFSPEQPVSRSGAAPRSPR